MRFLLLLACWSLGTGAMAAPVTYTLSNFNFADGGSAHGSFTYDSLSNVVSSVNIYTTAGTAFAGAVYVTANSPVSLPPGAWLDFFTDNFPGTTNEYRFAVFPQQDGVAGRATGVEQLCPDENCSASPSRWTVGFGTLTATAVPLPAAVWLFGSALAALGWSRRKQGA